MPKDRKSRQILYPPTSYVEAFHDTLIQQSGTPGYLTRSMVAGCLDWAKTKVYNFDPYPGLLRRAGAILYSYTTFHPFVDGNKRTALMTTSFFFFINGYTMTIPDDSPDFTKGVAERSGQDPKPSPGEEVERIAGWLKPNTSHPFLQAFLYQLIRNELHPDSDAEALLSRPDWDSYYKVWRVGTTERFKKLLGRWPGVDEHHRRK